MGLFGQNQNIFQNDKLFFLLIFHFITKHIVCLFLVLGQINIRIVFSCLETRIIHQRNKLVAEPLSAEKESCTRGSNLTRVYPGPCDPCTRATCDSDYTCSVAPDTREATCRCKATSLCLDVVEAVCASNGKTYRNQCTMDQVTSIILMDHFISVGVLQPWPRGHQPLINACLNCHTQYGCDY